MKEEDKLTGWINNPPQIYFLFFYYMSTYPLTETIYTIRYSVPNYQNDFGYYYINLLLNSYSYEYGGWNLSYTILNTSSKKNYVVTTASILWEFDQDISNTIFNRGSSNQTLHLNFKNGDVYYNRATYFEFHFSRSSTTKISNYTSTLFLHNFTTTTMLSYSDAYNQQFGYNIYNALKNGQTTGAYARPGRVVVGKDAIGIGGRFVGTYNMGGNFVTQSSSTTIMVGNITSTSVSYG